MWRHGGKLLRRDNRKYVFEEDGLVIPSATLGDAGQYHCLAANSAGSDKRSTSVAVHVPPVIRSGATNLTMLVNNPVTLECRVYGVPEPRVTWSKNGMPLRTDADPTFR